MNSEEYPPTSSHGASALPSNVKMTRILALLVGFEAAAVLSGALYFFTQLFVQEVTNLAGAVVIFLITAFIAIGLFVISIATWKLKSWTRGAIVTWQILQFAASTSFIQGLAEWQPVGWLLVGLSIVTLIFVFSPAVSSALHQEG